MQKHVRTQFEHYSTYYAGRYIYFVHKAEDDDVYRLELKKRTLFFGPKLEAIRFFSGEKLQQYLNKIPTLQQLTYCPP